MAQLSLDIGTDILEKFPHIVVAGFVVEGLDIAAERLLDVAKRIQDAYDALVASGLTVKNVAQEPRIADWRQAISACGLKPGTYKSSVEQLVRRFLKGNSIGTPLPIVNLYCAISAGCLAPLGGYDANRIVEDEIALRMGRPSTDRFVPLGGRPEDMPIRVTIPVYAAGSEILCWAFNYRDSRETCLSATTARATFLSEAVSAEQRIAALTALSELSRELENHGATPGNVVVADSSNRHVILDM